MMRIPDSLFIGGTEYKVKQVRVVDWDNVSRVVGQINYGKKLIKIKTFKGNDKCMEDTFFHEVAHGIMKELEFNHPSVCRFRNDEDFTQEFGLVLRKTFLDLMKKQKK